MGSPTVFSKLEVTSVVVVAIVTGMVLGGLAGTTRRVAGAGLGYTIASRRTGGSRVRRITRSNTDRASGVAFAGWLGAGQEGSSLGSAQLVNLSTTYQAGGFPQVPPHGQPPAPPHTLQATMVPTTMLPLAALPSAESALSLVAPQSPPSLVASQSSVSLVAPQSPAFLLVAPQSPGSPSEGSPLVELQPVAFLPGIYQATTYRLDVTAQTDAEAVGRMRPLWRLGSVLFSVARGKATRVFNPPVGSPPGAARPGRHRASPNKRMKRISITGNDNWIRNQ